MNFIFFTVLVSLFSSVSIASEDLYTSWYFKKNLLNLGNTFQMAKANQKVIVATIDTGLDLFHSNFTETQIVHGWDFVSNKPLQKDYHGHGTHVAGIIAGKYSGVASGISLMPLKYTIDSIQDKMEIPALLKKYKLESESDLAVELGVKAIQYAVDHNATIINYSGGGAGFSQEEFDVLKLAEKKGILVIVAAGNGSQDENGKDRGDDLSKDTKYYPCSYELSNIICVGNSDNSNNKAKSSNYGKTVVDLFAPGTEIVSSFLNKKMKALTGTSQSTPFVTGTAALIKSEHPELTGAEIKKLILDNVSYKYELKDLCKTNGLLNIENTIKAANDYSLKRKIATVKHP